MSVLTKDSLGGQNSHRRMSGARSSRALSTIFKRLRATDRQISKLDKQLTNAAYGLILYCKAGEVEKLRRKRESWDDRRRELRNLRKSFGKTT